MRVNGVDTAPLMTAMRETDLPLSGPAKTVESQNTKGYVQILDYLTLVA
jgi:hypothetical protein